MSFFTGKKFFYITFIGSILWIAAFSYLMVWWSTITGNAFSIPPEVRNGRFQKPTIPVPTHTTHTVAVYSWFITNNFVISVYCRCLEILCQIAFSSVANYFRFYRKKQFGIESVGIYTVNVLSAESTDECLRTKSQDN